jgi:ABC-type lipoprotein export system ATPase subunit
MWISRVRVTGGFLGGLDVRFGRGLNVVIGGRGAGKTTLLEVVRHALGLPHADEQRAHSRSDLVKILLGDGEVVVDIEAPNGTERLVVDADGGGRRPEFSSIALMLGQNELESIASNPESRLNLIDLRAQAVRMPSVPIQVAELTNELSKLRERIEDLTEQLHARTVLKNDLAELLAEEATLMESASTNLTAQRESLRELEDELLRATRNDRLAQDFDIAISETRIVVSELTDSVQSLNGVELPSDLIGTVDQVVPEITKSIGHISDHIAAIHNEVYRSSHRSSEKALRARSGAEPIRAHLDAVESGLGLVTSRIRNVQTQLIKLDEIENRISELHIRYDEAFESRKRFLDELELIQEDSFESRQSVAQSVTHDLGENVTVAVGHLTDARKFRGLLNNLLQGSNLKYRNLTESASRTLLPRQLLELVETRNSSILANLLSLNIERADRLIEYLQSSEALQEIASVSLEDSVDFLLRDGSQLKSVESLSTGQKCAVTLPILLTDHTRTLILDQPEDHLDNAYLVSNVIQSLNRRSGAQTQTIVATHNANIPVLGGAVKVIALQSDGVHGFVTSSAPFDAPDSVAAITSLMEGGREAFQLRSTFYRTHGVDIA